MKVEIRLLGGFQITLDGEPMPPMPLRAARSVLGFLAVHRDRVHTRDLLIGTFWPEHPEAFGRKQLRQALYQINKPFGTDGSGLGMIARGDSVGLSRTPGVLVDVDEFEWALERAGTASTPLQERGLLETAVETYRGDLLEGLYDDWILPERERLARRLGEALDRIADLAMGAGDYQGALEVSHRRILHDPINEAAHRRIMRILALLGRHDEAIRQYRRCARTLDQELGRSPSTATRQLLADIEADRSEAPDGDELLISRERTPMVGRSSERTQLAHLLDAVPAGGRPIVLIEGEPGVGKTRLLDDLVHAARWRGVDALVGRASDLLDRPFGPLVEAIGTGLTPLRSEQVSRRLDALWRATLAPLISQIDAGDARAPRLENADERARTREAFVRSLGVIAAIAPTALVIDDLHLADRETLAVLEQVMSDRPERLLIAVAYRHSEARNRPEVWDLLVDLEGSEGVSRLALAPLSPAQTEELVRSLHGSIDIGLLDRIHRDTGGIPLLVLETLRALAEGADAAPRGARSPARDHIRARIATLDRPATEVLEVLATAHLGLLPAEIATCLGSESGLAGLETLLDRHLAREQDGAYVTAHDLLRRTTADGIPVSRSLDLHRRIASALAQHRPEESRALALHYEAAHIPERAADYLELAAVDAMGVHALDDAADLLLRCLSALEACDAPRSRRFEVAAALEPLLDTLGDRDRQGIVIERMMSFADDSDIPEVRKRRARLLLHQDQITEAESEAKAAVEMARRTGNERVALTSLTTLAKITSLSGRAGDGIADLEQAIEGHPAVDRDLADACKALSQNLVDLQRFDEAHDLLHRALAIFGEIGDRRGQADVLSTIGTLRLEQGNNMAAESALRRAIKTSNAIGYRRGEAAFRLNLGIALGMQQRVVAALAQFDEVTKISQRIGSQRMFALSASNAAWIRHGWLGDHQTALRLAEQAKDLYERAGDQRGIAQCLTIIASALEIDGAPGAGQAHFTEALDLTQQAGDNWLSAQVLREQCITLLGSHRYDEALAAAIEGVSICETAGLPAIRSGLLGLAAWASLAQGLPELAQEYSSEAIKTMTESVEMRHLGLFSRSEVLRSAGQLERADEFLIAAFNELMSVVDSLPDSQARERALTQIPLNRIVLQEANRRMPTRVTLSIPAFDAPLGRKPSPDELVEVRLTISDPRSEGSQTPIEKRRSALVRITEEASAQGGLLTVSDLSEALGVSNVTIRRDLFALRASGATIRTRGSRDQ